jgi:uncharacterized alpha-E superfamily protein
MLSRVADAVFWMSRYVERAVAASRLVDVTLHLELDAGQMHATWDLWNPRSVIACIHMAREAARSVRDGLPSEMWEQLNTLNLWLTDPSAASQAEDNPAVFFRRVREGALYFQGLADSTMMHSEDWNFARLGMYLERADNVARALNLLGHLLEVDTLGQPEDDGTVRWLAVLRSCGAAEAYSRYYSLRVEPARVVEFLLLNPIFPQSVRFSLDAAHDALREIASDQAFMGSSNPALRALGRLRAGLEFTAVDELLASGLRAFLDTLQVRIADASDQVTAMYLSDFSNGHHNGSNGSNGSNGDRLRTVEHAAVLMSIQQQQQQQ